MHKAITAFLSLAFVAHLSAGAEVTFVQTDEFNGPFPSWRDVKRDYGAKGDGVADDSDAINKALLELRKEDREFSVLYFPAGVYRVTKTVTSPRATHKEGNGIAVIGEDPATTIIKWDGPDKGTVFSYTAWYSEVSRLTIDGAGRAGIAFLYNGERFSTYNETADMVFKDAAVGLQLGGSGGDSGGDYGQAENMVLRCQFLNCGFGLRTMSYNSLDIWVWNSLFQDCGSAMRNGAGNFNAYACVFLRSKTCDIDSSNLAIFSFIDNVSMGSAMFLDFSWAPGGIFSRNPVSICGNHIYDCTGDKGAIRLGGGPSLLWGNTIRNRAGDQKPVVFLGSDQGLLGNTFCVTTPMGVLPPGGLHDAIYRPRLVVSSESIVKRESIPDPKLVLPGVPAHAARQIFEVAPGCDATTIQAAIDAAAALKIGQRPVVHLPMGKYKIDKTLVIPAGTDLQLIGDGSTESGSALTWAGTKGAFLLRVEGPSEASLRDLYINNSTGNGVVFGNCDREGGRFYADRLNSTAGGAAIWVDGMDKSDVQFRCLAWEGGSLRVSGGTNRPAGTPIKGVTSVFCSTPGESKDKVFDIRDGATAILRTVYYDAGKPIPMVSMTGDANLFYDSGKCAAGSSSNFPTFNFRDFTGRALMTVSSLAECSGPNTGLRTKVEGDCSKGSVLFFGNCFEAQNRHELKDLFINESNPKCDQAGDYLSTFECRSLPGVLLRPEDIPVTGEHGAAHPASVIMHALASFADGARPHTPGMGDRSHARIHSVLVWVGGETGVLIQGAR